MSRVVALYRYPVKSFTPEPRTSLTIGPDGRVEGDRVLGFRFADTTEQDDDWSSKHGMLALVNTPGLARLNVGFDRAGGRLSLYLDGSLLVEDGLDAAGRRRISEAVTRYVLGLEVSGLRDKPERLPLRLVGDGMTARYQDSRDGTVTLHSRASLRDVGDALGDPELAETRFRSNIAIEGVEAWQELDWAGRRLRIGDVTFRVDHVNVRCLATHANPETGERDRPVLTTLTRGFGQQEPTFAVALLPEGGGEIRLEDSVTLLE